MDADIKDSETTSLAVDEAAANPIGIPLLHQHPGQALASRHALHVLYQGDQVLLAACTGTVGTAQMRHTAWT